MRLSIMFTLCKHKEFMDKHLNPAELVVKLFGGVRPAARVLNLSPTSIFRWKKSGLVPSDKQVLVLQKAKEHKKKLSPKHLIFGKTIKTKG